MYQPLEYFDRGIFVFMVQNYNLKKHFKGHKRHAKSEDLLYSVSNMVFLCFWVFITFNLTNLCDLSLQGITGLPPFAAAPFPQSSEATKYCSVRFLSSEELRSFDTKLQVSFIWSMHVVALIFSKQEKAFGQLFLIISPMI